MTSTAITVRKWNGSHFFLMSLCFHVVAFIVLGTILVNSIPEPRESISVQLIKAVQQVKKTRSDMPVVRRPMVDSTQIPKRAETGLAPVVDYRGFASQSATEAIPVFQYDPVDVEEPGNGMPKLDKPIAAPKVKSPKVVVQNIPRRSMGNTFDLHTQLANLSSPYSPGPSPLPSMPNSEAIRDYLQTVSRKIEKSKRYPEWAATAGLEGKVVVRFTVLRNGRLGDVPQLVKSSGTEILDNAAVAAVNNAAPFPALPPSLGREWIKVELPMDFRLTQS